MSDHTPTSEAVIEHPEHIPGYTYGTDEAATSPLSLLDLERLKEAVWLTSEDKQALRQEERHHPALRRRRRLVTRRPSAQPAPPQPDVLSPAGQLIRRRRS